MASEHSVAVVNYMKQHVGEELAKKDIAQAVGIEEKVLNGIILGLVKKEVFKTVDRAVDDGNGGQKITKMIVPLPAVTTFVFAEPAKKKPPVSEKTLKVAKYLVDKIGSAEKFTAGDVASALNEPKTSVETIITALCKKGHAKRSDAVGVIINDKAVSVKYLTVNPSMKEFVEEAEKH